MDEIIQLPAWERLSEKCISEQREPTIHEVEVAIVVDALLLAIIEVEKRKNSSNTNNQL